MKALSNDCLLPQYLATFSPEFLPQANVSRTYNDLTPELLDSCPAKPEVWRKMLFSLAFFHAVVQVRARYHKICVKIRKIDHNSLLTRGV
jgi:dynein heavy chain